MVAGAGGNATSSIKMAFAAYDPLSELVWSPRNGLSLKCADSSMPDNMWDAGPRVKDLSMSESMRSKENGDNEAVDDKLNAIHGQCDGGSKRKMEEDAGRSDANKVEKGEDNGEEDLSSSRNVQIADIAESSKKHSEQDNLAEGTVDGKIDKAMNRGFSGKLSRRTRCKSHRLEFNTSSSDIMRLAVPLRSEPLACSLPNLQAREESDEEVTSASGDVNKNKTRIPVSISGRHFLKTKSSAENDSCRLAEAAHILHEARPLGESSLPVVRSPTNSRIDLYQDKGKEKALSDGGIYDYGRSSNDGDDSNESVESCNSTGLFSKPVKRHSYDQEQLVGSKRMKKQVQECHDSTSIARHDSSFTNWISNMVKCLSDSSKEGSFPLALSNDDFGSYHQDKKKHDCESPSMGFETMFQSLYCRNAKMSNSVVQKDHSSTEESKELMVAGKKSIENLPQSCDGNNDNSCKQIILSEKEVSQHISRNSKPWIFSADFACTSYACGTSSAENKATDVVLNSTAEHRCLNTPLANCMPEKSNPPASLWITRLYTKTSTLENCNQITQEAGACSMAPPKAKLSSRITNVFSIDQKTSEARGNSSDDHVHASGREMQRIAATSDSSFDLKPINKLSPVQLSPELRSSEAMTSVFAKRLDAIKHIKHPSEKRKSSTSTLTCFFCGQSDHDLRKCPELTDTELNDLLVKISSFDRVPESPCLCIRCFQSGHWAISCPLVSSHRHIQSERNGGVISRYNACYLQLCADNETSHPGRENDDNKQVAARVMACSSSKPCLDSSNEYQKSTALNSENDLKDKQNSSPCNFINARSAAVPEEIFHAIRKLQMSRADILRWMSSNISLPHLNGFFLRLRLAQWEAGLGGTGYYVARITDGSIGDTAATIHCTSKNSIFVDVGGIKSSVGSQYVSNHDFLEDEIKAWWIRIVNNGGQMPSLHELNSKLIDRKRLGF
ncbi:uncharacterized protein LOC105171651 isoform X1 [Sesamum indicum]|uniref:Uncharacterized protein LOC105171651 isoform X1 n=1 Tax=Sesamum indicum TaxID=4182 RepID=A0A6I9U3D1_SESIN|nr:uncharacterized protein LOC105171651 isoform X1 [Sesamum indicum]XP_011091138.1 uncharacterized protein LOC105171651 isoform X1 [Sesamum indicum]XP_011091139.1 uncharacterized protein LOC105171651 isoform X1 [Sesamum indicum]